MNQKNEYFLEELSKTHESLDWLEQKIEESLEKIEVLEESGDENEEEINRSINDLDFFLVQLGAEKDHIDKLYRDFLALSGKTDSQ